ncbi:MAG: substrate-binding domain-containing protein [Rhizobium pusense]|nr:substrate-binding domain-containing protein [Agrobacterium pusense]
MSANGMTKLVRIFAVGAAISVSLSAGGVHAGSFTYNSNSENLARIEGAKLTETLGAVPDAKGMKIGIVLKTLTNQYWQSMESGMKAAAKDYGVDVTIQAANSESDPTQQLTILQTMIGRGFDAYVLSPVSVSNLTPGVKQLQERDIPIVNADDARIDATVWVGADHEQAGAAAVEYIAKHLPEGGDVAQIEGQAGSSAGILRIKGFKKGLEAHTNLKLVASVPANWDVTQAYNAAQTILRKNPDLKAFYANNDTMAVGVAKAVADMGLAGKVIIVGTDGIPAALDAIQKGTMSATVTSLPYYQGYWSVQSAIRLKSGQKVPEWVAAPAELITKDNITKFFDEKYDIKPGLYQ